MRRTETPEGRSVRLLRVGEQVRHVLSDLLARSEVHDDVLAKHMVSVTEVRMSPDLRHAKVFVSVMGSEAEKLATFEGLASTASHLRSRVGRALRLRVAPEIQFREDESVARAARIESLLAGIKTAPADNDKPGED